MYNYKEAVEEQLEHVFFNNPELKKKCRFTRLAGLFSLAPAVGIFAAASNFFGDFNAKIPAGSIVITALVVVLIGLCCLFITRAMIKE